MEASETTSNGHLDSGRDCSECLGCRLRQVDHSDDERLINHVEFARKALALTSGKDDARLDTSLLLSSSLHRLYANSQELCLLEEAICTQRDAISLCPNGHSDRAGLCGNLAISLRTLYQRTGDEHFLAEMVDLGRETVALCPGDHANRTWACGNLVVSLKLLHKHNSELRVMEEAVKLARELLAICPEDHPTRGLFCEDLASSLTMCYHHTSDVQLLREAIDLERQALALYPMSDPDRAELCKTLANTLKTCYKCTGEDLLLTEAVSLTREILNLRPLGHPGHATFCVDLASSLVMLYKQTGDEGVILEAIDIARKGLTLSGEESTHCASFHHSLSTSLFAHYERIREEHLAIEAINHEREALDLHPVGHPARASSCKQLANLLTARHKWTGDRTFLVEAVGLAREALQICAKGHPSRASACHQLAISLTTLHECTGDDDSLAEAIHLGREVLVLCPNEHHNRAQGCISLATALTTRYHRTGDDRYRVEAIALAREALVLCPPGHPDYDKCATNLALSLVARDDVQNLAEAIELKIEVLGMHPEGHPYRAISCANLANSLISVYQLTGNYDRLSLAIELERKALALRPLGHPHRVVSIGNLASSLKMQYQRTSEEGLLKEILALRREALELSLSPQLWRHLDDLVWLHLQVDTLFYDVAQAIECLSQGIEHDPDVVANAVPSFLGSLDSIWDHAVDKDHPKLIRIYKRLVILFPLLAHPALEVQSQMQKLVRISRAGPDAFVNAAISGDWRTGLESLDFSQSVIWSQHLHRRDPQLEEIPKQQATEIKELLEAMAAQPVAQSRLSERAVPLLDSFHAQSSRVYAILQEIRALPGLSRFMLGETYDTLRKAAANHPVVVLVGARGRYYALILSSPHDDSHSLLLLDSSLQDIEQMSFTKAVSRQYRGGIVGEGVQQQVDRQMKKSAPPRSGPLENQLKVLWLKVVKPVMDHLALKPHHRSLRPRLHWCPIGIFSSLPLHAAGTYSGYHSESCADFVVSSYTSTVATLLRAQTASRSLSKSVLNMALVAEQRALDPDLQMIPGVGEEVDVVESTAKLHAVKIIHRQSEASSVELTSAVLQRANIVHLACHGVQDAVNATQSGFCLGDGRLTIAKIMELKLDGAFLAFLSACETAKGDMNQPDQAMHLAAAMLFSGFNSVIATMWAIADDDGPKVARWFYEELLSKETIDANSVAYALDIAVGKLRESGVAPHRWAPFVHMGA